MEGNEQAALGSAPTQKKSGGSAAIIVICAILALGGVGFGIFEMIQANKKETPTVSDCSDKKEESPVEDKSKDEKSEDKDVADRTDKTGESIKDINDGQEIKIYNYVATKNDTRYVLRLSQHEAGKKVGYFEIATIGIQQAYEVSGYVDYDTNGKIVLSKIYDGEAKTVMDDTANALGFKWVASEGQYKKVEATFSTDSITLGDTKFEGINK